MHLLQMLCIRQRAMEYEEDQHALLKPHSVAATTLQIAHILSVYRAADRAYRCGVCRELYSMPPRMLHGRLHVMGSLKALAMTALIALLALGVSGEASSARLATLLALPVAQHRCSAYSEL